MRKYVILTGKLLKSGLGDMVASGNKKKKGKQLSQGFIWLLLLVCMLPMIGMLFKFGRGAYSFLAPIGQEGMALEFVFMAASLMNLLLGFPMIISVFYMTGDVEKLLYMPLRSWQIVGAKFTVSLFYVYLTSLYFFCPFVVGYGVGAEAGVVYWIFILIALLVVPVMPMIYSAVLSMVLMRVFKGAKNKDLLSVISVAFALIFALGISTISSGLGDMSQEAVVEFLMKGKNSLMGLMNGIFPSLRFLERAVVEGSVLQMLLFLGITAAALVVFFLIAEKLYFAGAMGMRETTARRKKISEKESRKLNRRENTRSAYIKKELRLLMRTPIYFMNCVMLVFIWPLLFLIPFVIQMGKEDGMELGTLMAMVDFKSGTACAIILFVVFCISMGSGVFNYVAGTAISREGKNFTFMKVIPVPYKTQLQAKLLSGVYVGVAGTGIYCLIGLLILIFGFGFPAWTLLPAVVVLILGNLIQCLIQFFIDLFHPKLGWESEQQAVKQNMNVMIGMFLNMGAAAGLGFLVFWLNGVLDLPITVFSAGVCIVMALLAFVLYKGIIAYGVRRLKEME